MQQEQNRLQQEQNIRQQQEERRQQQQMPVMRNPQPQPLIPGLTGASLLSGPNIPPLSAPSGYPQVSGPGPIGQALQPGFMTPGMGLLGSKPAGQDPASIPDLSRPPPGFAHNPNLEIPRLPYFELPAGLMVPLVEVLLNSLLCVYRYMCNIIHDDY